MAIGNMLLGLMSGGAMDPRTKLAAAAMGQPLPGAATPAGGPGAPGSAPAAPPPQAAAYTSPADLVNLYSELQNQSRRERSVDNGIGLIASSLAQPENRANVMGALGASGTGSADAADPLASILGIHQQQVALEDKARKVAALPAIAAQFGLDENTARNLLDNDQLDDYIMQASKPNMTTQVLADGTVAVIDQNSGKPINIFGPTKAPELTTSVKDYNFYVDQETGAGRTPLSFNEWDLQAKKAGATSITNNNGTGGSTDVAKGFDESLYPAYESAVAASNTVGTISGARAALDSAGGVITGNVAAPATTATRKVLASMFGFDDAQVENTDVFTSKMKEMVPPLIKQLGSGAAISDADRKFIEQMTGGGQDITEGAARRLLNIMELTARNSVIEYNNRAQKRIDAETDPAAKRRLEASVQFVPVPAVSTTWMESIPKGAIAELTKDGVPTADEKRLFDEVFGKNAADTILETLESAGGQ